MDKRDEITETPAESQSVENKSAVTIPNEKSIWNFIGWIIINVVGGT